MTATRLLLTFAIAALAASGAAAQGMSYGRAPRTNPEPTLPPGVEVKQHLGETIPVDLVFNDHLGRPTRLGDLLGKPTILVLAYSTCPKLCTEVLNGLVGEMKPLTRLGLRAGKDFHVITVSINPKDDPQAVRKKRMSYLEEYDHRAEDEDGWWFLTASSGQGTNLVDAEDKIRTLANAVGFHYVGDNAKAYEQAQVEPDAKLKAVKLETAIRKTKDYIHPSLVTVLTPDGTISQYFHGLPKPISGGSLDDGYTAEDLRVALSAANGGKIGTLLQRMAVNCFAYDDLSATYKLNMTILKWIAGPFVLMVFAFILRTYWKARHQRPTDPAAAQASPTEATT
jgi:protein SCO1